MDYSEKVTMTTRKMNLREISRDREVRNKKEEESGQAAKEERATSHTGHLLPFLPGQTT